MSRDTGAFTTLDNANMTEDEFYTQIEKARERRTQSRQPEIDALKAELSGAHSVNEVANKEIDSLKTAHGHAIRENFHLDSEIFKLKAENERLRKDTERYRWHKDNLEIAAKT